MINLVKKICCPDKTRTEYSLFAFNVIASIDDIFINPEPNQINYFYKLVESNKNRLAWNIEELGLNLWIRRFFI